MKIVRWAAVAATALMGLMNLPFILSDGGIGLSKPVAALVSLLGVAGLVAAIALARTVSWGAAATTAVGAVNTVLAVIALSKDWNGAPIGMVVSLLGLGLSAAVLLTSGRLLSSASASPRGL